ncbi:MAG TPA: hypothetical protein VHI76_02350 [Solirubrobacterales bacterium]|nr:hypothetical protein [Solirubrobacterales bacterium]
MALAVPLPALALHRGEGAASLDVRARSAAAESPTRRSAAGSTSRFSPIPDAEYYTASVTAPNGSVLELGTIAGGGGPGTSASIPFSGNGEYVVTVTACAAESAPAPAPEGEAGPATEPECEPQEAPEPPPVP